MESPSLSQSEYTDRESCLFFLPLLKLLKFTYYMYIFTFVKFAINIYYVKSFSVFLHQIVHYFNKKNT